MLLAIFFQLQFSYDCVVPLEVFLFQIFHMGLSVSNHRKEASARVLVFVIFLQMRCKSLDFFGEKRDLYFRRASVFVVNRHFLDYPLFSSLCEHFEMVARKPVFCKRETPFFLLREVSI